jgi:tetratricopeptide (TPR) repeat protein
LLRLAVALGEFWFEYNYYGEGRTWLERGLAATADTPTPLHARALVHLALFLGCLGEPSRAWELVNEGVTILRQEGDSVALSLALIWQGAVATLLGRLDDAEQAFDEVLGMAVSVPDPTLAAALSARALANLGRTAHTRGDLNLAMVRYVTALRICEEHGYVLGAIRTLDDLGAAARDQGKHAESLASFQKSLSLMGRRGDLRVVIDALEGAAQAAVAWDQAPLAARLLGAAAALGDVFGVSTRVATDEVAHALVVRAVHEKLDDRAFDDAYANGRRLTLEDAITEVQAMSPPTAVPASHVPSGVTLSARGGGAPAYLSRVLRPGDLSAALPQCAYHRGARRPDPHQTRCLDAGRCRGRRCRRRHRRPLLLTALIAPDPRLATVASLLRFRRSPRSVPHALAHTSYRLAISGAGTTTAPEGTRAVSVACVAW